MKVSKAFFFMVSISLGGLPAVIFVLQLGQAVPGGLGELVEGVAQAGIEVADSGVDPLAEAGPRLGGLDGALRRALARNFAETTKTIIAQRVSSIRTADKILVLEDGKEAGYGTHEELMRSCPSYREIADAQMGEVS